MTPFNFVARMYTSAEGEGGLAPGARDPDAGAAYGTAVPTAPLNIRAAQSRADRAGPSRAGAARMRKQVLPQKRSGGLCAVVGA
jgi:hypothetical protein